MGFGVTASGIIVMAVLFLAVTSSITIILKATNIAINNIETAGENEITRLNAYMTIKNASISTNGETIYFTFSNNGTLDYWDFDKFDLIVTYTDNNTGTTVTRRLRYGIDWSVNIVIINGGYTISFSQKHSVEPSESAQCTVTLPSIADTNKPIKIILVNQYGAKAIYKFTG